MRTSTYPYPTFSPPGRGRCLPPRAGSKTMKLTVQIANGHLGIIAIIGLFFQYGLTDSAEATGPSTPPCRCARL
eukprot:15538622-Heterocapsa_arctica.AAC.1